MIIPEMEPNDVFNRHLRDEALQAQAAGEGISVWHGTDEFTGEDVELLINLDRRTGGVALGERVFPCTIGERENLLTVTPKGISGLLLVDIDSETLAMNPERCGCDAFNDGKEAHVRLWDRMTDDEIMQVDGDEVHDLVDQRVLDPKDYLGSMFRHVKSLGIL